MPTGMSHCRICGKKIPSIYRPNHEKKRCLEMRRRRGDLDVICREVLPHGIIEPLDVAQKKLEMFK